MINYKISYSRAHRHYIDFEVSFPNPEKKNIQIQLPAWRPGRYELGNFAKYIQKWQAYDKEGKELAFVKLNKDLWEVESDGLDLVVVKYNFFANILNAGSTLLDEEQLYINPVNCFLYLPDNQDTPFTLDFDLPEDYRFATGMKQLGKHQLYAKDVQNLMDCPLIASNTLKHLDYDSHGVKFNIWIQGNFPCDSKTFVAEHKAFTDSQMEAFGDIPCEDYHFMYHFPEYFTRHGVEHENSTVISMGPSWDLKKPVWYNELLGISCHELYHTWNIKSIRPKEMMPYDFSKENYSKLGYVAEGVTTYYGDQYMLRSGVFDEAEYFRRLALTIERHIHNPGRFNHSVAQSSFDTWLDGYEPGVPNRKVSIYNEGTLVTFICDVKIMEATNNKSSLDDAMNLLYERFGKKGIGYTEKDYKSILEEVSGVSFDEIFDKLVWGTQDYIPYIEESLSYLGCQLEFNKNPKFHEGELGLKVDGKVDNKVVAVYPDSPADKAGITLDDRLLYTGTASLKNNMSYLSFCDDQIELKLERNNEIQDKKLANGGGGFYSKVTISKNSEADTSLAYSYWKLRK